MRYEIVLYWHKPVTTKKKSNENPTHFIHERSCMSFSPSQKTDNSVHTILLTTLPRKRRKRRKKWLVAVHWQVENYLFLIIWKKLWDRLFTVPAFSVRSSKSSVLRYRWMSVKTTNGTREGLGRSEKNRRLFKHYCALSSRSGGALGILRFLSLKFKRSYYGSW